tara:strand:- start:68 stop:313 length:246 start_codon:yes stop_codon:yes gene_type:complete
MSDDFMQDAKTLVVEVLEGKVRPESHPAVFEDDLLYMRVRFLETEAKDWLFTELKNDRYMREYRDEVIACLSPDGVQLFAE